MIKVQLELIIDEDEGDYEEILNSISLLDGVDSCTVVDDTYHEYNVDSDPFWEEEE